MNGWPWTAQAHWHGELTSVPPTISLPTLTPVPYRLAYKVLLNSYMLVAICLCSVIMKTFTVDNHSKSNKKYVRWKYVFFFKWTPFIFIVLFIYEHLSIVLFLYGHLYIILCLNGHLYVDLFYMGTFILNCF